MADTDAGYEQMVDVKHALRWWFHTNPLVYVAANLLLYYIEGDPYSKVAPDVFAVLGVPAGNRRVYRLWVEGKPPTVAFEFTSRTSRHLDPKIKVPLYEKLGVQEVYLFDPEGTWLKPRFRALHLVNGQYVEQVVVDGRIYSPALGLDLRVEGDRLRLYDPKTGQRLPTPGEDHERAERVAGEVKRAREQVKAANAQAKAANARAKAATAQAQQQRDEMAALKAEIERLRGR